MHIIHETVILHLSDGRFMHLDSRSSTNTRNDTHKTLFTATIHTKDELIDIARQFQIDSRPISAGGNFDLMIRNNKASWYDYGSHLLRMLKRSKSYEYFIDHRIVHVFSQRSVEFLYPQRHTVPLSQFNQHIYKLIYSNVKLAYRYIIEEISPKNEGLIVKLIDQKFPVQFVIGKVNHTQAVG